MKSGTLLEMGTLSLKARVAISILRIERIYSQYLVIVKCICNLYRGLYEACTDDE